MVRAATVFLFIFIALNSTLQAQQAETVEIDTVSIEISNVRIVTSQKMTQDTSSSIPETPVPLVGDKLLPPGTLYFVVFDYKSSLVSSDEPTAIKSLYAGVEIGQGSGSKGFQGYGPATLDKEAGTATVWLSGVFADQEKNVDVETALSIYGRRNDNNMVPSAKANNRIKFTARMDRFAQISETQFDALKALYKRVVALEARVKELESQAGK